MQEVFDVALRNFGELSECQCCERHQRRKPVRLPLNRSELDECLRGGPTIVDHTHPNYDLNDSCECCCRHEMRMICRMLAEFPFWHDYYDSNADNRNNHHHERNYQQFGQPETKDAR